MLERAAATEGVRVVLLTDRRALENVLEYVVQGNSAQLNDRAFVDELKAWIRFGDREALFRRDGLFSRAPGKPGRASQGKRSCLLG